MLSVLASQTFSELPRSENVWTQNKNTTSYHQSAVKAKDPRRCEGETTQAEVQASQVLQPKHQRAEESQEHHSIYGTLFQLNKDFATLLFALVSLLSGEVTTQAKRPFRFV